jgi:hypothetical protein
MEIVMTDFNGLEVTLPAGAMLDPGPHYYTVSYRGFTIYTTDAGYFIAEEDATGDHTTCPTFADAIKAIDDENDHEWNLTRRTI